MRRNGWLVLAVVASFTLLLVALFGERIAPHESIYFVVEHGRDPRPYDPGLVFPFGSDVLGRDLFSLVLAGAGATLLIVVVAGVSRALAGLVLAALAGWWPAARTAGDMAAELVAAVPATLVAVLIVKVFVTGDASFLIFVGALLLTGWAGPYRLMRTELDRLSHIGFTESARALGAGRLRVFVTHHLPHLVPLLAVNTAQQSVASLVAMAELGVLGVFVGATRVINIQESLTVLRVGQINATLISDPPEWGGLLANARSIESLWTTRWLFLLPGVAFAVAAVAIAAVGMGLARHYARRNLVQDLRGNGARVLALACAAVVLLSLVVPDRYPAAGDWANAARTAVRDSGDVATVFADAGLVPVARSFDLSRDVDQIGKTGPAVVRVGSVELRETSDGPLDVRAIVYEEGGGGVVDAPLVFAGWGISPADYPERPQLIFGVDFGKTVASFPDDYATVNVTGKVVVLLRYTGVMTGRGLATGPDVSTHLHNAIKRGAAAVILVDPTLPRQPRQSSGSVQNFYQRMELEAPVQRVAGTPVVVISAPAADRLLRPFGIVPSELYGNLGSAAAPGTISVASAWIPSDSEYADRSIARELPATGHVELPLARLSAHVTSYVAETRAAGSAPRIVIWALLHPSTVGGHEPIDALAAAARAIGQRGGPFVFVAFDPSVDATGNARAIADVLKDRRLGLFVVLDDLVGTALSFRTAYGDLVPAFDRYADRAGARHLITRTTVNPDTQLWTWPGIAPFIESKAVLVTGNGRSGDLRGDAAALVGYIAGRAAAGAEELPR